MEMLDRLTVLMEARKHLATLKAQKEEAYSQWLRDNDLLIRQIEGAALTVAENETTIKADAEAGYALNQEKHPCPGVEIKEYKEVRYDGVQAFAWAKEHGLFLTLDKKGFDIFAKATPLDFVEIQTIPKAQIATDLGKALPVTELKQKKGE